MILPLKQNAYARELTRILDQLSAVIDHLASCPGPHLNETALLLAAPGARWLLGSHRHLLDELLLHTDQGEREQLAQAVANDRRFDVSFTSPTFRLQYPALPAHVREHARLLLVAFYENLLKRGFELAGPNGTTVVLDRRRLEQGFFTANRGLRACPACMEAEISPAGAGAPSIIDCDHFLPKSLYGPLAIHPQNLVFMCIPCNARRKGRADPLTGARPGTAAQQRQRTRPGVLRRSYLPYRRAALGEMEIRFAPAGVTMTAATAIARERVANMDRTFKLSRTWSEVLPRAEREMFEELDRPATSRAVKTVLERVEARGAGAPGQLGHGVFLRSRYAAYLREHHLEVLRKDWQRKAKERRMSAALYP
jgi:hypothetical protein